MAMFRKARMARLEALWRRRIELLEAHRQGVWPSDVVAAKQRTLARVHRRMGIALEIPEHPTVQAAEAWLADDTPARAAADAEILRDWARQHPATLYADDGMRERIAAKLDATAHRLEARRREPDA
jgi:hypothetical protein